NPDAAYGGAQDIDRDTPRGWERQRRRAELRVEAADGKHEVGVAAPGEEHAHLALDAHEEHARVEDRREEVQPLAVKLQYAGEVDLEDEDGLVIGGEHDTDHADDGDVAGDLEDDTEGDADDRRGAPAELRHRTDQEGPLPRGEDRAQVTDDAGRVG